MLSRRWPRATPVESNVSHRRSDFQVIVRSGPPHMKPKSSGPRWASQCVISSSADNSSGAADDLYMATRPHIRIFAYDPDSERIICSTVAPGFW